MNDEPTVVYSGKSLDSAADLTRFLCENGVDAKLIKGDPLGHAHPAIDFFHDVIAGNTDHELLTNLISEWESQPKTKTPPIDGMFCYHCGEGLDQPAAVCPHCNETLTD